MSSLASFLFSRRSGGRRAAHCSTFVSDGGDGDRCRGGARGARGLRDGGVHGGHGVRDGGDRDVHDVRAVRGTFS